ncbi:30S ribosomal protein S8 [Candidatus Uabimicrobium amorphum]|uniref:Small ribosomal subunit protein uS8 n=1 Tax=Uabimicrobium amorphum TaxID=2596890 RepID=A0A5S9F4Y6_UABAM|nr:30S ribosomal protein S8 [Candidatus Uabimicrobium amorphum]BBM85593.1 30S ribosomal protein S8 [Candidatus Uabimicrobium amorphum]
MRTDPIADMLTMIRNANAIYHKSVVVPHSRLKEGVVLKLKEAGFIKDYKVIEEQPQDKMEITLKYGPDGEHVIRQIARVSKPSRKIYRKVVDMKRVLGGQGINIVSTSKGILTDKQCREQKVGGEVLCVVW